MDLGTGFPHPPAASYLLHITGSSSSSSVSAPASEHVSRGTNRSEAIRKKHSNIPVACGSCQKRKSRCDGKRPSCGVCLKKSTHCLYEADAHETRGRNLKRRNEELTAKVDRLEYVLNYLKIGKEHEVSEIVARIRSSNDCEYHISYRV
jgi:hypothetical protein